MGKYVKFAIAGVAAVVAEDYVAGTDGYKKADPGTQKLYRYGTLGATFAAISMLI